MGKYILAIDQGTTGTTTCLVDRKGMIVEKFNKEFPQIFPQPGWVEHNLDDIWETVTTGIQKVLDRRMQLAKILLRSV
ncbi:MAG: FGGY family carbohydrate kinase [Bdellovibrionales bacterium]